MHYKGWSFRLADWVHAYNSDDPSKPVMGQVFKAYISDEPGRKGEPGITVCWYYRPEQTVHPAHRQFWENEVFKTSKSRKPCLVIKALNQCHRQAISRTIL